jgi:hypothetical protein
VIVAMATWHTTNVANVANVDTAVTFMHIQSDNARLDKQGDKRKLAGPMACAWCVPAPPVPAWCDTALVKRSAQPVCTHLGHLKRTGVADPGPVHDAGHPVK